MIKNGEAGATEETEPDETHDTKPGPSAFKKLYLATLGGFFFFFFFKLK